VRLRLVMRGGERSGVGEDRAARTLNRGVVGNTRMARNGFEGSERQTRRPRDASRCALRGTGEDLQPKSSCWRHESCPQRGNHVQTSPKAGRPFPTLEAAVVAACLS
jgi:hypothetical protein